MKNDYAWRTTTSPNVVSAVQLASDLQFSRTFIFSPPSCFASKATWGGYTAYDLLSPTSLGGLPLANAYLTCFVLHFDRGTLSRTQRCRKAPRRLNSEESETREYSVPYFIRASSLSQHCIVPRNLSISPRSWQTGGRCIPKAVRYLTDLLPVSYYGLADA